MIESKINNTQLFVCEDTANVAVKNIILQDVEDVANYAQQKNFVIKWTTGEKQAVEKLNYFTNCEIVSEIELTNIIRKFS